MVLNMMEYYDMIKKNNLNIVYSGPLWADGIEGIAETLKRRLKFDDLPLPASQSVFSVFIEQITNMLMYSAEKGIYDISKDGITEVPKGVFVLGVKNKMYFIQSGNVIRKESADLLKGRIDHLNTLDKAQMRKFYKERLKSEDSNPESKGAGLGLIEIARRASSKIEYDFTPLEDGTLFYSMFVTIGQEV